MSTFIKLCVFAFVGYMGEEFLGILKVTLLAVAYVWGVFAAMIIAMFAKVFFEHFGHLFLRPETGVFTLFLLGVISGVS